MTTAGCMSQNVGLISKSISLVSEYFPMQIIWKGKINISVDVFHGNKIKLCSLILLQKIWIITIKVEINTIDATLIINSQNNLDSYFQSHSRTEPSPSKVHEHHLFLSVAPKPGIDFVSPELCFPQKGAASYKLTVKYENNTDGCS